MAKKIIIADVQKEYIERLQNYIQKHYMDCYEIKTFSDKTKLVQHIATHKCDILLMTPRLYDEALNLKNIRLPIILQNEQEKVPDVEKLKWIIQKYTRISTMVNYIKEQYEEVDCNRPLIYSIYSPAGGVGQTTIALGVALSYAKQGKKVLYINLEETDSTDMFLEMKGEPVENVELEVGQEVQDLVETIKQDYETKLMYMKWNAFGGNVGLGKKLGVMIEALIDNGIANSVILDLGHQYGTFQKSLMEQSDYIVLVADTRTHSRFKMSQLLNLGEDEILLSEKVRWVLNQGKEGVDESFKSIERIGTVKNRHVEKPIEVCQFIANNKLLKLHGLD